MSDTTTSRVGVVVIGRNEGERLTRCLRSLIGCGRPVVYIDSGSTDGSVDAARQLGVLVHELDPSRPFSAARGRNEGLAALESHHADLRYVQFVDGDCEIDAGWIDTARCALDEHEDWAIVCGRLREIGRDASVYNRLCDIEWQTETGEVGECGGIFMARIKAFDKVGGLDENVPAGEEPELCLRLRRDGWKVVRLADDMGRHDAQMTRFGQWWRRLRRVGFGYALAMHLHGNEPERAGVREVRSTVVWAAVMPLVALSLIAASVWSAWFAAGLAVVFAGYVALGWRVYRWRMSIAEHRGDALVYAAYCVLAKWPQLQGVLDFKRQRRRGDVFRVADKTPGGGAAVAYLTNVYPATSHSFIRREIAALEAMGVTVHRFAVRPPDHELADPADVAEAQRVCYLLGGGGLRTIVAGIAGALRHPLKMPSVMLLALRSAPRNPKGVIKAVAYLLEAGRFARWVERLGIKHVHVHFGTNPATVAMLAHKMGGPSYSFTAHGTAELDDAANNALDHKLRRAVFGVAVCQYQRSQLMRWTDPADHDRLHVVRCGVDDAFLRGAIVPIGESPQLLSVGRLSPEKGQLVLIEAVAQLVADGRDARLIMVGDGPMRDEIEAMIGQHGLVEHVHLAGWASGQQVREHLNRSRVLVLSSFAEGLPVVLLEALAMGRPAVATQVSGIPEVVEPAQTGWLVPAGDAAALADAIGEALDASTDELEKLGRNGRERVAQMHDCQTEARRLLELFYRYGCLAQPTERVQPHRMTEAIGQL